jgi:hypothetical protein
MFGSINDSAAICLFPFITWDDPSMNSLAPLCSGTSLRSGLTLVCYFMMCSDASWFSSPTHRKLAGFRQVSVVKTKSSLSNNMISYFRIWESVSHFLTFWLVYSWPDVALLKVNFLLSYTSKAIAATVWMHSGHSLEMGSRSLEMKATSCFPHPLCSGWAP